VTGPLPLLLLAGAIATAAYLMAVLLRLLHPPRRTLGWALGRGAPADPDSLGRDLAWEEQTLDPAGSAAKPLLLWRIAASQIDLERPRRAVILLHGWGHGRRDGLDRLDPLLSLPGTVVIVPDLRGHGDSPGSSGLGVRDLADLRALIEEAAPLPTLLVGHSMGGVAAIHAAAELARATPQRQADLRGVIAVSAYERLRVPVAADLRRRGFALGPLQWPLLLLLRLLGIHERSTAEAAARLAVPLLLLHGELDDACPLPDAEKIATASARGLLVPIADGGHNDLWRRCRRETAAAILGSAVWSAFTSAEA
jgi:pimeloyl-ACP methyl ester carboxylesterase